MRPLLLRPARMVLDTWLASVRYAQEYAPAARAIVSENQPVVFLLWHGRLLPLAHYHRRRGYATLVSRSGDGDAIAYIAGGWGYTVIRGSSSRGGDVALRQLVRELRAGRPLAITPDGPRGPARQMKPGALLAAQLTGAPVLPVTAAADRAWWFGSWDRFLVPQPFSRVLIRYGEPVVVPRSATGETFDRIMSDLGLALTRLTDAADNAVGKLDRPEPAGDDAAR